MTTDSLTDVTITTGDGTDYDLGDPLLAGFTEEEGEDGDEWYPRISLPAKVLPGGARPEDIERVSGTREGVQQIDIDVAVEYESDWDADGVQSHDFKVLDER